MTTFLGDFENLQSRFPASGQAASFRSQGRDIFLKSGLPTRKDEAWHYTSVKALSEKKFELALLKVGGLVSKEDLRLYRPEFFNIVFINGKLDRVLSDWEDLKKEIHLEELSANVGSKPLTLKLVSNFEALNLSYFEQGLCMEVPSGVVVSKPVQVMNVVTSPGLMAHPRLNVKVGNRSKLVLIESFSSHAANSFQNSVCEGELMPSANLEYFRVQDENRGAYNIGQTRFVLREGSSLEALSFAIGGKLARHNLEVLMVEKNAHATINGLTLGAGDQHLDHFTLIDHIIGECTTRQLYKSVLNHQAHSVFTGKVIIRQGSQKASSQQLNNNLLLSKEAEADSRPQLEILADDVQATHGSTVGQLSSEELFYLLSRGIAKEQAIEMLSLGFVQDLVFRVANLQVRNWLNNLLIEAYRNGVKT